MCEHLERLLRPLNDGRLPIVDEALYTVSVFDTYTPSHSLHDFENTLRSYGFTDAWDIELLTAKYYYGMGSRLIAEDQKYISRRTVSRRLGQLRKLLEERWPEIVSNNKKKAQDE